MGQASWPPSDARLLNAVPEPFVVQEAGGKTLFTNDLADELFGFAAGQIRGRQFESLLWEGCRDDYREYVAAQLEGHGGAQRGDRVELQALHRSGRVFPVELSLRPVGHGKELLLFGTLRDIARRKIRERETEALLAATASLGLAGDPEALLRTLVEEAASVLEADRGQYAILRHGRIIIPSRWINQRWDEFNHETRKGGILSYVRDTGRPFRSNSLSRDPHANRTVVGEEGLRSQLTGPLLAPDAKLLGFITLYNSRRPEGFSERDERVMEAICQTGAAILRRERDVAARRRAEREISALLTVAERLNGAADPEDVLLQVVEVAGGLLGVRRVSILTNEGDHVLHRFEWSEGVWARTDQRLPREGSISGWVITNARPYRSDDLPSDPLHTPDLYEKYGSTRALALPVFARSGEVCSVLSIFDRLDGRPFTDEDQRLAEGIAHHASVALERSTLVQQLRERERHLHLQAVTDPLTDLPNRRLFLEHLNNAVAQLEEAEAGIAVLFLDLDGFKIINDSLGHGAGDTVLKTVARRLTQQRRRDDIVARFGGDEFAVLLRGVADVDTAVRVAERIVAALKRPFSTGRRKRVVISASVGVSYLTRAARRMNAEELLREADIALYQAKATAPGQVAVFETKMGVQAVQKLALHTDLQRALDRGEFLLYYQPLVRLDSGACAGMEALLRWQHPQRGLLPPDEFINAAEETGLILPIGRWVLSEACRQAAAWHSRRVNGEPFRTCVNLSTLQFEEPNLVDQVGELLHETGVSPAALELEITETVVIRNPDAAIATLHALRKLGVRVAIDDFGTGYSSLSYLQRLPVDTLKIDRSFVMDLRDRGTTAAILQSAATMAHALHLDVTAEGIETEEQLLAATKLGCDYGQGYLLSVPLPANEADTWICSTPMTGSLSPSGDTAMVPSARSG